MEVIEAARAGDPSALERILQYFSISSHIRWRYVDGGDINETKSKIEIY